MQTQSSMLDPPLYIVYSPRLGVSISTSLCARAHTHALTHAHTHAWTHNAHLRQEDRKTDVVGEYPERTDLLRSVSVYDLEPMQRVKVK